MSWSELSFGNFLFKNCLAFQPECLQEFSLPPAWRKGWDVFSGLFSMINMKIHIKSVHHVQVCSFKYVCNYQWYGKSKINPGEHRKKQSQIYVEAGCDWNLFKSTPATAHPDVPKILHRDSCCIGECCLPGISDISDKINYTSGAAFSSPHSIDQEIEFEICLCLNGDAEYAAVLNGFHRDRGVANKYPTSSCALR